MTKFISEPLDSCNKNLVNTKQSQTIGDYLCQQVRRWLRNDDDFKANGRDNIKLPVYYSQCGKVRMENYCILATIVLYSDNSRTGCLSLMEPTTCM